MIDARRPASLPALECAAAWLARPLDASSLAAFRILFGLILCGGILRFVLEGWVEVLYVEPTIFLKYWGFSWVRVWPRWGMYAHYGALAGLALCIAVGYRTRVAATLFFVGFTYVELMDVTNYLNHYYLVSILSFLMSFLPVDRLWSIDVRRRGAGAVVTVPAWAVYVLRLQIAIVYISAGLAKFGTDWLLHAQPLGIWLAARSETPLIGAWLVVPWMAYAMSWAGFFFDSTIVLWLSLRRTRPFAYIAVLVFHCMTHVLFSIGLFPFLMTAFATIFFEPDWARRLVRRINNFAGLQMEPEPTLRHQHAFLASTGARFGAVALVVFCLAQIVMPLRHHLYAGDVLWNEQGMRWAWKVMVREKNGSITYHVRDRDSGRTWQVSPTRYLTWRQANEMAGQPDLILQLAHHVADDMRARGVRHPEVRAEAWVSLNGRRSALMIDPTVDLAKVDDGVAPAAWILPGPDGPPFVRDASRQYAAGPSSADH